MVWRIKSKEEEKSIVKPIIKQPEQSEDSEALDFEKEEAELRKKLERIETIKKSNKSEENKDSINKQELIDIIEGSLGRSLRLIEMLRSI